MNHVFSAHKNNSVRINRYADEPFYTGGNPIASVVLVLFGVAAGLVLMPVIKACDKPPVIVANCQKCHVPPKYRTLAQYKAHLAEDVTQ